MLKGYQWASSCKFKISKFQKFKMAAAAILKKSNTDISPPWFERFWQNLAQWRSSSYLTVPSVKNPRWWLPPSYKIQNRDISTTVLTDRHEIWHGDEIRHLRCVPQLEICNFKKATWRRPPFWKSKKRHISTAVSAISTRFGRATQFGPRNRSAYYKFKI